MYCLDTSAVLELLYGTRKGEEIKELTKDRPVAISSFTVHELLVGLKESNREGVFRFLKGIEIVSFDGLAGQTSAEIERQLKEEGKMINTVDIFIAAICLEHHFTLVTCDSDFKRVHDLLVKSF